MRWIIQHNLYNEAGYVRFIEALDRMNSNYTVVKPVPFFDKILPVDFDTSKDITDEDEIKIDDNEIIVVMGAYTLSKIARKKGWTPGSFDNENFNFVVWSKEFGLENILNDDAIIGKFGSIKNVHNHWNIFIRPLADTKSFSGKVLTFSEFEDWQKQIIDLPYQEDQTVNINTDVLIASPKEIFTEYRFFVVNGKIITYSLYKRGNSVIYDSTVDDGAIEFAKTMIEKWTPAVAFVIDVADTPTGFKVIEINNFNSAGFYAADVQKIVFAIEEMYG